MHAAHRSGKEVVDGFLSRPTAGGERPAIVLVHGYRGLDDGQRAVTRRFAQEGFVCLSPDLFHGKTYHTLEDCAFKKTRSIFPARSTTSSTACPICASFPGSAKKRSPCLGFCMGGGLALYALAQSKAFDAGVIYYQSMFPDPEDLKSISAPMLVPLRHQRSRHDKNRDRHVPRHDWIGIKKKYEIEMYEGAGHAFLE